MKTNNDLVSGGPGISSPTLSMGTSHKTVPLVSSTFEDFFCSSHYPKLPSAFVPGYMDTCEKHLVSLSTLTWVHWVGATLHPEKPEDPPVEHEVSVFLKDPVRLHQAHADHKAGVSIKENRDIPFLPASWWILSLLQSISSFLTQSPTLLFTLSHFPWPSV